MPETPIYLQPPFFTAFTTEDIKLLNNNLLMALGFGGEGNFKVNYLESTVSGQDLEDKINDYFDEHADFNPRVVSYSNYDTRWSCLVGYTFITVPPVITISETDLDFGNVAVDDTDVLNYTVSAVGIVSGDLTVTASAGFTVCLTEGGVYTESVTVTPDEDGVIADTIIYVEFSPIAGVVYSGTVTNVATGAVTKTVNTTGVGALITVDDSDLDFGNQYPGQFTFRSYHVSAIGLTDNLVITAPAGFNICTEITDWATEIILVPVNGVIEPLSIIVRFQPTTVQDYSADLPHTSTGVTTVDVALTATGTNGVITADPLGLNFGDVYLFFTKVLNYTVSAIGLQTDLTITAPDGFTVCLTEDGIYTTELTITPDSGVIEDTIIYVKFSPILEQDYASTLTNTSFQVSDVNITLAGEGIKGEIILDPHLNAFGNVVIGDQPELQFTVNATGVHDIAGVTVTSTSPGALLLSTDDGETWVGNLYILPDIDGNVTDVVVKTQFTPTELIAYDGFVNVTSPDVTPDPSGFEFTGVGIVAQLFLEIFGQDGGGDSDMNWPAVWTLPAGGTTEGTDWIVYGLDDVIPFCDVAGSSGGPFAVFLSSGALEESIITRPFSTVGKNTVTLNFNQFRDVGAVPVTLSYSIDNITYIPVAYTAVAADETWASIDPVVLPVGAEGHANVYLKFTATGDSSGNATAFDDMRVTSYNN